MKYLLHLPLLVLLAQSGVAQPAVETGSRLLPVPLPPGGLVPYRKGNLWGYADTAGRVVLAPRFPYQAPPVNLGHKFIITHSNPWEGDYREGVSWRSTRAVNIRGEELSADPDHALVLQADSSLMMATPGQPGLRYVQLAADGNSVVLAPAAEPTPPIPTGELPYAPRENFERDGRYGPLGFSRQIRQKNLWPVPYFNKYMELKWASPEGPKALANARNRRLTGYRYGQIFPFHDGLALVNQKGRHGYIDLRGRRVVKPQFGFGSEDFYRQRAVVTDAAGNQALIDTRGRFVLPFAPGQRLRYPSPWGHCPAEVPLLVCLHYPAPNQPADAATFFTYDGQPAFPGLHFTDALPFELGRAWVRCGTKVGLIDAQGNYVLPCRYDELLFERVDEHGNFWNGYRSGSTMTAPSLAALRPPGMNEPIDTRHLRFRLGGRYGYLQAATGQEIIPARYDSVQHGLYHGFAFLRREGQVYMVDGQGRELATGSFKQEFWREGQRFMQLTRPGEWCVVDTTGRQCLPWQPVASELVDFQPASGLTIVRRPFRAGSGHWRYRAVGPNGPLTGEEYSQLLFWGPEELLGERPHVQDSLPRPRYVVHDHRGRLRRTLDYYALAQYAELGRAVLVRPDDATAGTLVIDTQAGGVLHRLPGSWEVVPFGLTNEDGQSFSYGRPSFELPLFRARPFRGSWSGLFKVTENAGKSTQKELGYLDRHGRRSWED